MAYFELQEEQRGLGPRRLALLVLAIACLSASAVVFKSGPEDWSAFNWRALVDGSVQIWRRLVDGAEHTFNLDRIGPAASTLVDNIEAAMPILPGSDAANPRTPAAPMPTPCKEHLGHRGQCGCAPWSAWEPESTEICPTPIAQELNGGRPETPIGQPSSSTLDAIDAYLAEHPDEDVHASYLGFDFGGEPPPLFLGVGSGPKPPKPPIIPGVPEPGAWALLITGCALLGLALRPSRRKAALQTALDEAEAV